MPTTGEAETTLSEVYEALMLVEYSPAGRVLRASPRACELYGGEEDELVGLSHSNLCPGETSVSSKRFWKKLSNGEAQSGLFKRQTVDGRSLHLQGSYVPIVDATGEVTKVVSSVCDVTATYRKLDEANGTISALRRSQGVIEFELDGTIVEANDAFLETVGYSEDEVVGKHHRMFCSPEEAQSPAYRDFWQKLRRGEFDTGVYQRIRKDGSKASIRASYNPILDEDGKAVRVIKFASDITESRRMEAKQRGVAEAISRSQAVIEFELDGTIVTANENFLKTLGYTLDEVVGKHHRMFCSPEETQGPEYEAFWQKLRQGKFDAGVYQRIRKDGSEVTIRASYNPILDESGKPIRVMKFAADITESRREEAKHRGLAEAISRSQAVIEFKLDGTIITANENFLNTLGYTLDEVVGKHHRIFCSPEEAQSPAYKTFWQKLQRGEFDAGVYQRIGKDGSEVTIRASYNPILDHHGQPRSVIKFASDITEVTQRNAEFEGLVRAIERSQAMIEFDLDGTILNANKNFLAVVGYSLDDLLGRHHRTLCESEYTSSREYQEFWESLRSGNYDTGRYKRIGQNNKEVWIQASYNPIVDVHGKPTKVVKFATDITAQVEVEGTVARTADEVKVRTQNIMVRASEVAEQSERLGMTCQEMSANVEELTASIASIADGSSHANSLAKEASGEAEVGMTAIRESLEAMDDINRSSDEVAEIVKVISEIASQTNLLAFNAAIEAARAGQHGRGFAVVADEVRKLAERSSKATNDISKLISETTRRIRTGSDVSRRAADAFTGIVTKVESTYQAVTQIATAAQEQSIAADEVNAGIQQVSMESEKTARSSEEISTACNDLDTNSTELVNIARNL
ncbi:MAG: PAS domain S-box protein [Polyangiales bacterium]